MRKILLILIIASNHLSAQCIQKIVNGESYMIAIGGQGGLYGWGDNTDRQLGIGNTDDQQTPQLISSDSWQFIAASDKHTLGIKSDGTLWAWGSDTYERLGNGISDDAAYPMQIGTETNWKEVAAGERGSLGLKTDGTLWGWGTNNNGYLGNNTTSAFVSDVPVQLGSDNDWLHIAGNNSLHALAIKTNGTLWGWGKNQNGQLGLGTTTDVQAPVQIGAANDWKWIETGNELSFAIKNSNSLWGWGVSSGGGLPIDVAQPMQIGPDSDWKTFSLHKRDTFQYALMTKTNGTLWAWGSDNGQQLGNGTDGNYGAPTQIGTDTDWADATAGYRQGCAVKTNGDLWTWGDTPMVGTDAGFDTSPLFYDCSALAPILNVEQFSAAIRIYPNPTPNVVNIDLPFSISVQLMVCDLSGKIVLETYFSQNTCIDLESFASGQYIMHLRAEGRPVQVQQLIKR